MESNKPFLLDRLASFAGYVFPPVVVDAMLFTLPRFSLSSHRIVECFQRSWELWSPNSSRYTFYPGVQEFGTRFGRSLPASMRRYDGHDGRFDPTVSPQHFDKERPWLAFIQTSPDVSRPEFTPFTSVWVRDRSGYAGKFNQSFVLQVPLSTIRPDLWEKRPLIPTKDDVVHLNRLSKWEEAVDYYTELQREIKYLAAWCSMADAFIAFAKDRPEVDRVMPANETIMGVWLNGCEEEDGKWLLANRVPCYVIHELSSNETRDGVTSSKRVNDFHTGTGVVRLRVAANALDQIAKKGGNLLRELNWDLGQASATDHKYLPTDRERSALDAQGWRNGVYYDPKQTVVMKILPSTAVASETSGLLLPPPITRGDNAGGWSKWSEEELEDEEYVLVRRGKHYPMPPDSYEYHDRINNRRVYLNSPLTLPSNYKANPWTFGLPVPSMRSVELEGHMTYANRPRTTWVYLTPLTDEEEVGRCYNADRKEDQYDGRALPGFEPESDEELAPSPVQEEEDDIDCVSIPEDDLSQGLYSNSADTMTTSYQPLVTRLDATRLKSIPIRTPATSARSRSIDRPRQISPPRSYRSRRSPSPKRSQFYAGSSHSSAHHAPYRRSSRNSRSPRYNYSRNRPRSPSPYHRRYQRDQAVASNNSYDSRGRSFRSEEGSSRNPQLSHSDRHRSPAQSPIRFHAPTPAQIPSPVRRDRSIPLPLPSEVIETVLPQKRGRSASPEDPPPIPASLLDRISLPDSNTIVLYNAQVAAQNSGLHALAMPITTSMTLSFPAPVTPLMPILRVINEKGRSRFLVLWNLPIYLLWENVIAWITAPTKKWFDNPLIRLTTSAANPQVLTSRPVGIP
ncbi:hypothetical protein CPC08DRAFT_730638, partial [Agrocybe pediades]